MSFLMVLAAIFGAILRRRQVRKLGGDVILVVHRAHSGTWQAAWGVIGSALFAALSGYAAGQNEWDALLMFLPAAIMFLVFGIPGLCLDWSRLEIREHGLAVSRLWLHRWDQARCWGWAAFDSDRLVIHFERFVASYEIAQSQREAIEVTLDEFLPDKRTSDTRTSDSPRSRAGSTIS